MTRTELEKALEARKDELATLIAGGRKAIINSERNSDPADQTQLIGARELDLTNLGNASATLHQVRAAQQRLAEGKYGICQECEKPISQRRLDALPHATRCVRCQEEHEKVSHPVLSVVTA